MEIFGIDISHHQGNFDIKNAKNQGVKYVIIRAGYTGSLTRSLAIDSKYERNYKLCKELKVPVGVYWYSRATSYDLGMKEAKYLYEKCLINKQFEYPIYIDVEDTKYQAKASKQAVTDAIIGFCDYLEKKGYYVGIYGSDISTFKQMVNIKELTKYDLWVARYGSKPSYVTKYGMWQFSSTNGKIKGAGNKLDLDYAYKDYPTIIKKAGLNGYKKQETTQTPSNSSSNGSNSSKTTKYYKKYTGKSNSLVNALSYLNIDSSFSYRKKIAKANRITLYVGTAKQNLKLLNLLKQGKLVKP
jgi:GH25 family lysozyme M1 (1,4-beta-N-acetylmuramidase)